MEESEQVQARLTAIEERLSALEAEPERTERASYRIDPGATDAEQFWALEGLKQRVDGNGGVIFAGAVRVPDGPVEWQYGSTTDDVQESDWADVAADLAALGSPVRLSLLQAILTGTKSVADLAASPGMGSAGQLYHHLNQLTAHGWLIAQGRGSYSVPVARIVPLMVIITAARKVL